MSGRAECIDGVKGKEVLVRYGAFVSWCMAFLYFLWDAIGLAWLHW